MGDATSGDGGNDDPHRAWRRPAPGDPEPATSTRGSAALPGGNTGDPQRAIWGPESETVVAPTGESHPAPAPPSWHPPSGTVAPLGAAPGIPPTWPMARHEPDIGIDEWQPSPPRPTPGGSSARWWARGGIAAAILAAVLIVVAVASGSAPGDDASTATSGPTTSPAPPTTARRAVPTTAAPTTVPTTSTPGVGTGTSAAALDLAPEDDPRVMLTGPPEGFTAVGARLLLDHHVGGLTSGLLFVADGATWFDGPWIRVSPGGDASFVGPVASTAIGDRPARVGRGASGAELVVVDGDDTGVAIEVQGLPPGTAATSAAGLAWGPDGSWSVPLTALPPGLRLVAGDVAESIAVHSATAAMVSYQGSGGEQVAVYGSIARPGYDPIAVAPFLLADLTYVTIGGDPGVTGTYRAAGGAWTSVQWRHRGVDIEMSAFGLEASELLALAAHAATRTDGIWTERQWAAAVEGGVFVSGQPVVIQSDLSFGDDGSGAVVARRIGTAMSWWVDGSTSIGIERSGEETDPIVLRVAANSVSTIDRQGVTHLVAVALGDVSIEGATVRLRVGTLVDGTEGVMYESGAVVHPLGDVAPGAVTLAPGDLGYTLGAAVTLPWTEGGFVAELVAADGVTILATATPAELR